MLKQNRPLLKKRKELFPKRKLFFYYNYYSFVNESVANFLFASLILETSSGAVVIIWSSVWLATTLKATCFLPAKNNPSPTAASSSKYFSCSVKLNVFCTTSMVAGDCFIKNCKEEFVIIGFPYSDFIKSATSWVIVVTPSQYFLPLFAKPNKNEAPSSDCISHQASSTTSILFLSFVLTIFQT